MHAIHFMYSVFRISSAFCLAGILCYEALCGRK